MVEVLRKLTVFLYMAEQTGKRVETSLASQIWPKNSLVINFVIFITTQISTPIGYPIWLPGVFKWPHWLAGLTYQPYQTKSPFWVCHLFFIWCHHSQISQTLFCKWVLIKLWFFAPLYLERFRIYLRCSIPKLAKSQ